MMLLMISQIMESTLQCQRDTKEEIKTETNENASDRESSIESFHTNKSEPSNTTETEIIDLDEIELSDEESWLYKSPKKVSSDEKSASTQKWLQKNVNDMDDLELRATRTALLSKLNQLKLLNSSIEEKQAINKIKKCDLSKCDLKVEEKKADEVDLPVRNIAEKQIKVTSSDNFVPEKNGSTLKVERKCTIPCEERKISQSEEKVCGESEVFDVLDVQKIAKLQEESLKQSTSKFLNQSGRKALSSRELLPSSPAQIASLNKPASIEALNYCADKMNQSNVYSIIPLHCMKKQNMFSSSSTLNCSQEFHRGSLPNINKGYYSLKSKKSKRSNDPKPSCPLPVYPSHSKVSVNGTIHQSPCDTLVKSTAPIFDPRESRTLPSSYRVNSRSNSSSRRDINALSPSPRRESAPFWGSNSSIESNQRENYRKFSSPVPFTNINPRHSSSSSSTTSPTKTFSCQPKSLRSPPSTDYHRATSHSPSRRLPLTTVQHQSPKKGNNLLSSRNGEIRSVKVPSKIPSPASRSGIPVPSTTYMPRAQEDDTWSQDCF